MNNEFTRKPKKKNSEFMLQNHFNYFFSRVENERSIDTRKYSIEFQ